MKRIKAIGLTLGLIMLVATLVIAGGFSQAYKQHYTVNKGASFSWTNDGSTIYKTLSSITVTTDDGNFGGSNIVFKLVRFGQTQELYQATATNTLFWDANDSISVGAGDVFQFETAWSGQVEYVIVMKNDG